MTIKEQLVAARAVVEKAWCRKAYARDAQGYILVNGYDEGAAYWCSAGACELVTRSVRDAQPAIEALSKAAVKMGFPNVFDLNDSAEDLSVVLEMFDLAIKEQS